MKYLCGCGKLIKVSDELAARQTLCPRCGSGVVSAPRQEQPITSAPLELPPAPACLLLHAPEMVETEGLFEDRVRVGHGLFKQMRTERAAGLAPA